MARWHDEEDKSTLTLVFGKVDAKVLVLGRDAAGVENSFGILVHPYDSDRMPPGSGFSGTDPNRAQAKARAIEMLSPVLHEAIRELPKEA